jgi:lipopolysaccharide biosynthesis protein
MTRINTTTAIYVILHRTETAAHVALALDELATVAGRIIVVTDAVNQHRVATTVPTAKTPPLFEVISTTQDASILSAYRAGLAHLLADGAVNSPVILTGYHAFGPLRPGGWQNLPCDADLLAPYWHNAALDVRLQNRPDLPDRIAYLDFARLSADLVNAPAFQQFWADLPPFHDHWDEMERGLIPLARYLRDAGFHTAYALPPEAMQTADPRHNEVDQLVAHGAPCLPLSCLTLDPLLHDLNGVDLRAALDQLRALHPALYRGVIAFALARVPLRSFATIADQYEVLSPHYPLGRTAWRCGPVAVFIHAFYADMMPELWAQIVKFPMPAHLFLSTASPDNKAAIERFLDDQGWPAADRTVRVVAQNRGRDMSALFITFRDVALSGRYDIALRLHSKRTPQVTRQVAAGFKAHLFDNLVHSPRCDPPDTGPL